MAYSQYSKEWYADQCCLTQFGGNQAAYDACFKQYTQYLGATPSALIEGVLESAKAFEVTAGAGAAAETAAWTTTEAATIAAATQTKFPWFWLIGAVLLAVVIFTIGGK